MCGFQIDGLIGGLFVEQHQREVIPLGVAVFKGHAQRDVDIRLNHEVGTDAVNQDVEGIDGAFQLEDLLADQLDPAVIRFSHHLGILLHQTAEGMLLVLFFVFLLRVRMFFHKFLALANERVQLFAQIFGVVVYILVKVDQRAPIHIQEAAVSGVVIVILILTLFVVVRLSGDHGGGDGNAGKGTHINVGVELIIVDVGDDPGPFPDGAAADIDAQQHLLFKDRLHGDGELVSVGDLDLLLKFQLQLGTQAIAFFKVLQHALADLDGRTDILFFDLPFPIPIFCGEGPHGRGGRIAILDRVVDDLHAVHVFQVLTGQGHIGQVVHGLVDESALLRLSHDVGLHGADLRWRHLHGFGAGVIDVHGSQNIRLADRFIGDNIGIVHIADILDSGVAVQRAGLSLHITGIEGNKIAHIHRGLGAQTHFIVLVIRVVHHGLVHGDLTIDLIRVGIGQHRKHIGGK